MATSTAGSRSAISCYWTDNHSSPFSPNCHHPPHSSATHPSIGEGSRTNNDENNHSWNAMDSKLSGGGGSSSNNSEIERFKENQLKKRFYTVCACSGGTVTVAHEVWLEYEELKDSGNLDGDHLHWLVCLLYLESRIDRSLDENGQYSRPISKPPLRSLLKLTRLEPHRFFYICRHHAISENELQMINDIERSYQVGIVLAIKFQSVFQCVFDQNHDSYESLKEFAWLLFCWARIQSFSNPWDLVHSFNLMLAIHELMFKASLQSGLMNAVHPELESSSTDNVLSLLCRKFQANYNVAHNLLYNCIEPLLNELSVYDKVSMPLLNDINSNKRSLIAIYDGLLEIKDVIDELKRLDVEDDCCCVDDFDEIHDENDCFSSCATITKFLSFYSSAKAHLDTLLAIGWEDRMIQLLRNQYSEVMSDFDKAHKFAVVILHQLINELLAAEVDNLDKFLFSTPIIHCLFECAMLLIQYWQDCNDKGAGDFAGRKWSGSHVPAYYMYSIIQPVIRSLLPIGLCRNSALYLLSIEEYLIQCEIFSDESVLWQRIDPTDPSLPSSDYIIAKTTRPQLCDLSHSITDDDQCTTMPSPQQLKEVSISGLKRSNNKSQSHKSAAHINDSLTLLMSKLYALASRRLDELCCQHLRHRERTGRLCWYLLEHIIKDDCLFFRQRHLDQIIMCVVYAVSKAIGQPTSFQQIINAYRDMGGNEYTFRRVRMYQSGIDQVHVGREDDVNQQQELWSDIIEFYNKVFVIRYKSFICRLLKAQINKGNDLDLPTLPDWSVDSGRKFTGSPLKLSPNYSRFLSPRKYESSCSSGTMLTYTSNVDLWISQNQNAENFTTNIDVAMDYKDDQPTSSSQKQAEQQNGKVTSARKRKLEQSEVAKRDALGDDANNGTGIDIVTPSMTGKTHLAKRKRRKESAAAANVLNENIQEPQSSDCSVVGLNDCPSAKNEPHKRDGSRRKRKNEEMRNNDHFEELSKKKCLLRKQREKPR